MPRALLPIALIAGLAGCAHGHVVMAPDGQPATYVTCHHQNKCYVKAQRLCPWGYQVLDAAFGSLLFRCGPYEEPSQPAPEQNPNTPPPADSTPRAPTENLYRT